VPPFPIARYLVPPDPPTLPDGFTRVDVPIVTGLPFAIKLDADSRLILTLPSGLAHIWRDADPKAVVSSSTDEIAPNTPATDTPVGDTARPPIRLSLVRAGSVLASIPLATGLRRAVPDAAARFEVIVFAWEVRAGSLRGPGDFSSWIDLAWRRADVAASHFDAPPVHPHVAYRLPMQERIESHEAPRPDHRGRA
jgi:hypothetical protein